MRNLLHRSQTRVDLHLLDIESVITVINLIPGHLIVDSGA